MKRRAVSILLALVMCLSLLPGTASAAERELTDWYFLFAIFKNVDADCADEKGQMQRAVYSMPREEVSLIRDLAAEFREYMDSLGVMRTHVDVIEIDATVTELAHRSGESSYFGPEQAAPFLEGRAELDRYDHVFCILDLDVWTGYAGMTHTPSFENGTGMSHIHHRNWENLQNNYRADTGRNNWHVGAYVHEFLHFAARLDRKWGEGFDLHRKTQYTDADGWRAWYTDLILNRPADGGTGVYPAVWQYPPHVIRATAEWNVPSGVTGIGGFAFDNCTSLTRVTIPSGVTSMGVAAFQSCTSLTSVSLPASVAQLEAYAFANCPRLTDVYYGGTEAQWKAIKIGDYNGALTSANIHYNHLMADVKTTDAFAPSIAWALGEGITGGTGGGRFSPNSPCTQAQILTFLWRAKGSPKPAGAVSGGEYYAAAVQWAKEQDLIDGTFSAGAPCTRAMAVTYLWKLAGSPAAGAAAFTDVPAGADCAGAVSWAVEQGVTAGTGGNAFSPDRACTRGQIVTFLHRALAG